MPSVIPRRTTRSWVTANYKMSFDLVRNAMNGLNAWLLVLETFGINVWCAAGKGTFGTEELIGRIVRPAPAKPRETIGGCFCRSWGRLGWRPTRWPDAPAFR